jgi:PKD repeat protein
MWKFGDRGTSPVVSPSNTYTNTTNSNQSLLAELMAISVKGCLDTANQNILVYPKPTASYTADFMSGCQPLGVNFTQSSTLADFCSLDYGDQDTFKLCGPTSTHIYTNTGSFFPRTFNSELTVTTANGCSSTQVISITVNPQVIADFSSIDSGCSPLNVNFVNQSIGSNSRIWTFGDGSNSFTQSLIYTYINSTAQKQKYTSQLVAISQYNCTDTMRKNLTVFGKPIATISPNITSGCSPLAVNFGNGSQGQDSCNWNFGDGTIFLDSCGVNLTHIFENNFSVAPISSLTTLFIFTDEGCKDTTSQIITIDPKVTVGFSAPTEGCSPFAVTFTNQSLGAPIASWTFGDGGSSPALNPSHTYNNTSDTTQRFAANLRASNIFGCFRDSQITITVHPKPQAVFSAGVTSGCEPLEVTFTQSSNLADNCILSYGDLDTFKLCGPTSIHTFLNPNSFFQVTYNSELTVTTVNGYNDTQVIPITVNPRLIADFSSIDSGCSPLTVGFLNQSTGSNSHIWTYGDGANSFSQSPTHTYINPTTQNQTYNAQLVAVSQFNCTDTMRKDITVFGKPIATVVPNNSTGCHPLVVNFNNQSQGQDSCNWVFGDGFGLVDSCGVNVVHTFDNLLSSAPIFRQTFLYVYTDEGCSDTANQIITINPNVEAAFYSPTEGCSPFVVNFGNQSTGAPVYNWAFGDGGTSPASDPRHTFIYLGQSDTTFTTNLRAFNNFGCFDDSQIVITVNPKPIADYSINTNESCQPVDITFTNNSSLRDSCSWIFGDGTSDLNNCQPNLIHTYINRQSLVPLDYLSELRIYTDKGCSDILTRSIRVKPQVIADFSGDTVACSPFDVTFRSQSFGAVNYNWNFGDGAVRSGAVANHIFTNTGSVDSLYIVTLTASSLFNCDDVFTKTVRVHPTPLVRFTATPLTQEFPDTTVIVTNTTSNGNWSYVWAFGDGKGSQLQNPGSHNYSTWGNYTIQLKASSQNCIDSAEVPILIEAPTPVADFGDSAVGCEPLQVTFKNKSLYGQTYNWDFGDGGRLNSENPTHTYFNAGEYTVTLNVVGFPPGKTDQITKLNYIKVNKEPMADFITSTSKIFIPNDPVVFSNRSRDADSYRWEFGDGNSSAEQSPTYFYTEEGEFRVLLIAYTNEGCVDSTYAPTDVIAELEGKVLVPNAFTPNPNGSNGGVVNINPGAGNLNDVFYAKVNGTTKYELNIFNKWGELLFVSKDINIGWDGYYRGALAQQDSYVWKVTVEFADGTGQVKVGDLLLLR